MTGLLLATVAAMGVFYLYTALALGWRGLQPGPSPRPRRKPGNQARQWLTQAGLADVRVRDFAAAMVIMFMVGTAVIFALFGAILPALAVGVFVASFPLASYRARRRTRRAIAQDTWPHLLEEVRLLTGSLGRSIPQAFLEAGLRGPEEMKPAFRNAQREWLISTDFERTLAVLKAGLADPTADATCETLLVAHELGGSDLDRRLAALIDDRTQDTQGRKDARAKQAGARFARRFVLFVPFGMALAGMSVGDGRAAFQSVEGQLLTLVAVLFVIGCWAWAGRILHIPEEQRVFTG